MTIDCKYRELERGEIYKRGWDGTGKLTALTPEAFIQPYLDLPTLPIPTYTGEGTEGCQQRPFQRQVSN
jgi:hypothetical protein